MIEQQNNILRYNTGINFYMYMNKNPLFQIFNIQNNQTYLNNFNNEQNKFLNDNSMNGFYNYLNINTKIPITKEYPYYKINTSKKISLDIPRPKATSLDLFDNSQLKQFEESINSIPSLINHLRTQRGTKEIQKLILKYPKECITILINKLNNEISLLMIDLYGNYFCQFILKLCNPNQITMILNYIRFNYINIAKNNSGTHVLQTLCDMISNQNHEKLILSFIEKNEIEMAYHSNATHVLQKIIISINEVRREKLNNIIIENFKDLCLDVNGICVVKKFINSNILSSIKNQIISIITNNCVEITQNPFGNYAIQYTIEVYGMSDCESIINIILKNICELSTQKYSSNVTEKIINILNEQQISILIKELFYSRKIMKIIKNKFGKYVLKRAINILNDKQKEEISNHLSVINVSNARDRNKLKNFISFINGLK